MSIKAGDWVTDDYLIGVVKNVWDEDGTLDIVIYDRRGEKLGRVSPQMGGPKSFEPCCDPTEWRKIKKPCFPISKYCYLWDVLK